MAKKFISNRKKWVLCSRCECNELEISEEAISGICWVCVAKMVPPPKITQPSQKKPMKVRSSIVERIGKKDKKESTLAKRYKQREKEKRQKKKKITITDNNVKKKRGRPKKK